MSAHKSPGPRFLPQLSVRVERDEGRLRLLAPSPGIYRRVPAIGQLIGAHGAVGELEVLGVVYRLQAPEQVQGRVVELPGERRGQYPVDYHTPLLVLDPTAVGEAPASATNEAKGAAGPVFRSPLGGRYYRRPTPDAEPFVSAGDTLRGGETVGLIEVMKTFNRVQFSAELSAELGPVRVTRIVPADGDDIEAQDVLLELERA